jgi:hypothetical protein
MKPGDLVNIPAHKKHQVEWTTAGRSNDLVGGVSWEGELTCSIKSPFQSAG